MKIAVLAFVLLASTSCAEFFGGGTEDDSKNCLNCARGPNPFPKGYDPSAGGFNEDKMLASIGVNGIYPMVLNFSVNAVHLNKDVQNFCSLNTPTDLDFEKVQVSWTETMMSYHQVAAAPIGPTEDNHRALGNNLYAWPLFNSCGIDIEVARLNKEGLLNPDLFFTIKGLAGLEYLLFERTYGTSCKVNNEKSKPAFDWTQNPTPTKQKDRCRLAKFVAQNIETEAQKLEFGWNPDGGNFSKTMIDGSEYKEGIKQAVNAMSDALFAIENVKDQMLGIPLGFHANCTNANEVCPESAEHQYSGLSISAAVNQLKGFRQVFTAGNTRGFNEFLSSKNHPEITIHLLALVDKAIQSGEALSEPGLLLKEIQKMSPGQCRITTTTNRVVPVCAFFRDVQELTKKMKIEFLTALSLSAPPGVDGDID